MPNTWSIKINQNQDGTVTFQPDTPTGQPDQPLGVQLNDLVTWNNRTNQPLTLQAINPSGVYITETIPAGQVSDPTFSVAAITAAKATALVYSCVSPSQKRHSIVIINAPPPTS